MLINQGDLRRMFVDALCSVRGGRKLPDIVLDRLLAAVETWLDMKPGVLDALPALAAPPAGVGAEVTHNMLDHEPYIDLCAHPVCKAEVARRQAAGTGGRR